MFTIPRNKLWEAIGKIQVDEHITEAKRTLCRNNRVGVEIGIKRIGETGHSVKTRLLKNQSCLRSGHLTKPVVIMQNSACYVE